MGNTFYHRTAILKSKKVTILRFVLISCLLSITIFGYAQRNVRIGFLDIDKVLAAHKGYGESNQELERKISDWRKEIESKQEALDEQREALDIEKPLLTDEIFEERTEDIDFEQEKLDQYIQKRFGTEGDWLKQRILLAQPAQDEILTAIREIADDRNLDYVFDSTADILVLHSEKKYDISDLVIRYIEIEDKKKAQEFLSKTKKEERRQRANPALEERRKALEQRKAERLKLLEERKAERNRKRNSKNISTTTDSSTSEVSDQAKSEARKAEVERKKKERAAELAQRKKEQAEAIAKRKQERLEELERRKKELEEKRKQAQQKK